MSNKQINLGTITLDWHFAKGKFSCNCATTEDINAFDRIICGILYRSNNQLSKERIATLMGFNVIDNPMINRYADRSECTIFNNAVLSLINYGLVKEYDYDLLLTEKGRIAFETGYKQKESLKEVDLWVDEYSTNESTKELFKEFNVETYQPIENEEWNTLTTSPVKILQLQNKEIINETERREVTSMSMLELDYYVAHVPCNVCLDLPSNNCIIYARTNNGSVNEVLLSDGKLQDRLKEQFFSTQTPSVIYKQNYQEEIEDLVMEQELIEGECIGMVMPENMFFDEIGSIVKADDAKLILFSIHTLTSKRIEQICKLTNKIVCIEYVEGGYEDEYYIANGVCFRKVGQLRAQDLCMYDTIYYSVLPFVVDFGDVSYNIPLLYRMDEEKYDLDALYLPFSSYILNSCIAIGRYYSVLLEKKPSSSLVSDFIEYCRKIEDLTLDLTAQENTILELNTLVGQIINVWKTQTHERLNSLESDMIKGQTPEITMALLREIEKDVESSYNDEELQKHIDEIKERFKPAKLNIRRRSVYILDTSVFMNMPNVLDKFSLTDDKVVIPRAMEQELDGITHDADSNKSIAARKAHLFLRRKKDDFPHFISIKEEVKLDLLPNGWDLYAKKDNHMAATAIELSENEDYDRVIIVSDDKIFLSNVGDLLTNKFISDKIEAIDLSELLMRLSE